VPRHLECSRGAVAVQGVSVNDPRQARRPSPRKEWHALFVKGLEVPLPHVADGLESLLLKGPMNRNQIIR
jgi:hypothetical protein